MFAQSFPSLFIKFSLAALVWAPACSSSEDPSVDEAGIGSTSGKGGSGGKSGNKGGKGGKGGSTVEAGAPSSDGEGGAAGSPLEPPHGAGSGGGAGVELEPEPEPGRGGSSGGSESGSGGSTSPAAGDSGMSRGGEPGEEPEPGTGGTGGTAGRPAEEPNAEAVLRGKALAEENLCVACHQDDYAGLGFYPNLTPDVATGLGDWSDVDIANAIQNGYDRNGESLCSLMGIYPFTNEEASDIVAFLRQLPAVSNQITAVCPGHGQ